MRASAKANDSGKGSLDFVGDHLAINFLNTLRMHEGVLADTLQSDENVVEWLRRMNVPLPLLQKPLEPGPLLRTARNLRTLALRAVEQKKASERVRLNELNAFLANATSQLQLKNRRDGLDLERVYLARSAEQYLAPVTEAIADLLANGDFDLVRRCEGEECVLWFYDRTKGHRRRWCTERGCGTRARVAAFRARRAATSK